MATTAFGPLKITLPSNLPKNEKDLICMLLAGRLKDLFRGRLLCAQLAINDLLKDMTGVDALGGLASALNDLKGALNNFKEISGYNDILNKVNQTLGLVNTVFSLGGLCPSPVRAPRIPDLLGQLNQNLFGQANALLNGLAKVANPTLCLGGGPGGFGVNWNSLDGDLKNLKNLIQQFKNNPAGYASTIAAFEANLKGQARSFKSELARLKSNLSDPLGLNQYKNTAAAIQRAKSVSDGYKVKDSRGIEYENPTKLMIPADVDFVLSRNDAASTKPIQYTVKPVLDYCGNITGYEKVVVSGDPAYAGWNTFPETDAYDPEAFFNDNPTTNPVGTYAQYDFLLKQQGSSVVVLNKKGETLSSISITRGKHYRIGFELVDKSLKLYNGSAVWIDGLTYSQDPEYGKGIEVIIPDASTEYKKGELDWAVLLENPTTPNVLKFKSTDIDITVNIDGPTAIRRSDRVYDVSNAVRKSLFHKSRSIHTADGIDIKLETDMIRTYETLIPSVNSATYSVSTSVVYDEILEIDIDLTTATVIAPLTSGYLISKYIARTDAGFELRELNFFVSSTTSVNSASYGVLITFDSPINISSATKLVDPNSVGANDTSYKIPYQYKLAILEGLSGSLLPVVPTISNSEEMRFRLDSDGANDNIIKFNMTTNDRGLTIPVNEFILEFNIKVDPTDLSRSFTETNPIINSAYFKFIKPNNTGFIESEYKFTNEVGPVPAPTPAPTPGPTPGPTPAPTPSSGVWVFNSALNTCELVTFVAGPVPTYSTESQCRAANGLDGGGGGFVPTPGMVAQRDYFYTNLFSGSGEGNKYIDLRPYTPTNFERQPVASGNGVVYSWLIDGVTFQTALLYDDPVLTTPRLWKFGELTLSQRRTLLEEYGNSFTPPLTFIISGSGPNDPAYTSSTYFDNFLNNKGIEPADGTTFTSNHGDVFTWSSNSWTLTTPWVRPTPSPTPAPTS